MAIQLLSKKAGLHQERSAMHYNLPGAIASLQDPDPHLGELTGTR